MRFRVGVQACFSAAGLAAAVAGSGRALADELTFRGLNVEKTITCDHRDVVIRGANHRLTLRGRCPKVVVRGSGHLIRVEALGRADLTGMNNRLEWERSLSGDTPVIEITGVGNRAVRAGQPAEPGDGRATPDQGRVEVDGGSGRVTVDGGSGRVTTERGRVEVEGGSGRVVVGPDGINIEGVGNARGAGTVVTGRSLSIADNDAQRAEDCAGGNASVLGNENQLALSRCRQVTVSGDGNQIVLVGPVRTIRVLGDDNTVEWSQGEGGEPPKVENAGKGNRVLRRDASKPQ